MTLGRSVLVLALGSVVAPPAYAAPLLGSGKDVEGLRVYRDHPNARLFYYAPGKLSVAVDRGGTPQISFLQMRYTGTAAAGDRGAFRTMSNFTFRVRMEGVSADQLAKARMALRGTLRFGGEPILKPLPIRRVTAQLNYLPLQGGAAAVPAPMRPGTPVGPAKVEETEDPSKGDGYWTERYFTLAPDDATSSLLWESFQKGRVLLSLGYAFYSDGIDAAEPVPTGTAEPAKKGPHLVLADTLAITLDAAKYPDRIRRVDINESIPAQYAALSVACYDFNNALRPDLQVKVVEIEAKSVTGQPLKREVVFSAGSPDLATASLRFPFAVSLKQGYRYRVREITAAGEERVKPWKDGPAWSQLLDVTTPPEERPAPPPEREDPS